MKTISKAQTTGSHYCECDRLERFNLSRTWPENPRQRPVIFFLYVAECFVEWIAYTLHDWDDVIE